MLVLSRKLGDSVFIGDNIKVTVVCIRGDKVRLGFSAPKETTVHRHEVYKLVAEERKRINGLASGPIKSDGHLGDSTGGGA